MILNTWNIKLLQTPCVKNTILIPFFNNDINTQIEPKGTCTCSRGVDSCTLNIKMYFKIYTVKKIINLLYVYNTNNREDIYKIAYSKKNTILYY